VVSIRCSSKEQARVVDLHTFYGEWRRFRLRQSKLTLHAFVAGPTIVVSIRGSS
jgi:hypothetical protein